MVVVLVPPQPPLPSAISSRQCKYEYNLCVFLLCICARVDGGRIDPQGEMGEEILERRRTYEKRIQADTHTPACQVRNM